ncbi:antibiotic biosynthesis monooxygenase [Paenibacillus sp. FJAT-26967]|uniref:antibiotic biosynthesis monooxygenase family protein n=1 Tax=Paenibacillus sp. FJAT-26967 TaxID=1729690 RepID=UPI000839942C|nr:antibiotic biosynthesis monooxygenase [Paenibacillus sp. FJAT-26967]
MFIQTRSIVVQKGFADQVVERFSKEGLLDQREGLIDINVMVNRISKENEEVLVMIRWASLEDWKNWEKSPEHIQGHKDKKGQPKPEYMISMNVNSYELKKTKIGPAGK